jgi:hypothetical protein
MMLQILLHRLVAQPEPQPSLRGYIDGLLQIQFVQVNHVFEPLPNCTLDLHPEKTMMIGEGHTCTRSLIFWPLGQ